MVNNPKAVPYGIALPQVFPDGPVDMGLVRDSAIRAEALGYDGLWVMDQITGGAAALEPINLLSYAAAVTSKIRLGTSVIVVLNRNPVILAKEFSTLDNLSDGRLIVGLGLGNPRKENSRIGAQTRRRVDHFVESLEVMRALWEQPQAKHGGQFWTLDGDAMEPKPVQRPGPPIWFGAGHPDALRRAVRHGDGWMGAGSSTTQQFRKNVEILNESLDASGRDPSTFPISKRVYIGIDDDEQRGERGLQKFFAEYYGNAELALQVAVRGSISRCVEGLNEILESGAQMLMFNPAYEHMRHLETIAQEIVPQLRG